MRVGNTIKRIAHAKWANINKIQAIKYQKIKRGEFMGAKYKFQCPYCGAYSDRGGYVEIVT